ncbi:hypothetical protein [Desulfovirgula thermocuniculi]|uniref:hypothetical protein n=1 Tax=Desulfovirgula thermocuniculi TaxID=348842 RepID=UPI00316AE634
MITSIATNQRIPSLPIALKIAKHFNKSVDELFMLKTAESKFSPDKEAQLLG